MLRKFLLFLAAGALFIGLHTVIELKTRGFCLQRIFADDIAFNPEWETPPLSSTEEEMLHHALDQPYTFLGAGSECFAFESQDKCTVIKFFKLDKTRTLYFHRGMFYEDHSSSAGTISTAYAALSPSLQPLARRILGMREYRIARTFNSLKLAYDALKEETGVFYLHLNRTEHLHKTLTIRDSIGIAHQVDLDRAHFFLQHKAIPLQQHLLNLKNSGEDERAKRCIASFCDLILTRSRKGFADRDVINRNFGFLDERAVEIDSGSFILSQQMQEAFHYKRELLFATAELKEWLEEHYSTLIPFLNLKVAEEIQSE